MFTVVHFSSLVAGFFPSSWIVRASRLLSCTNEHFMRVGVAIILVVVSQSQRSRIQKQKHQQNQEEEEQMPILTSVRVNSLFLRCGNAQKEPHLPTCPSISGRRKRKDIIVRWKWSNPHHAALHKHQETQEHIFLKPNWNCTKSIDVSRSLSLHQDVTRLLCFSLPFSFAISRLLFFPSLFYRSFGWAVWQVFKIHKKKIENANQ